MADSDWLSIDAPQHEEQITCKATLLLPDGQPTIYHLKIEDNSNTLTVFEVGEQKKLPAACPPRHINKDGSFCLGWGPTAPPYPTSPDEAQTWWGTLAGFLKLQNEAMLLKRWRGGHSWPHGPTAAEAQHLYEKAAQAHPKLAASVEKMELARERQDRVRSRRMPCPCGSGKKIKDCHEELLVILLKLINTVEECETAFWAEWVDTPCCQTMDDCPLNEYRKDYGK